MRTCLLMLLLVCALQLPLRAAHADSVRDLPLVEVPAAADGDMLALLISGDGGWASLDQQVSAELARRGIAVVGLSSLKYFWQSRTPEVAARDVADVLHHYLSTWQRSRIALIGYSRGADVMPFIVTRLPADLRARLTSVSLLGLATGAQFEVSFAEWLHPAPSIPVAPELSRIDTVPVLCVYGEGEQDSLCPSLALSNVTRLKRGDGHHFGGDYRTLGQIVAEFSLRPLAHPHPPAA